MKRIILAVLAIALTGWAHAAAFVSSDKQFTIDLPSGWSMARKPVAGAVLSVVKGNARIDIKKVPDCQTESCIEQKTQKDLLDVKSKKMQIIANSYTGEQIKRIDFTTGEPFFYISFFTPKNDFSAGYFLIGQNAYSVLAKDLSYAQTDLIFSFISPTQPGKPSKNLPSGGSIEIDTMDSRAYDIEAAPAVAEEELIQPDSLQRVQAVSQPTSATSPLDKYIAALKKYTLITHNMPPYIQQLGPIFDLFILLVLLYLSIQLLALIVRIFVPAYQDTAPVNPNSPYPIKFRRLYGTPSLIFRARDNQGNTLLSLTSRWDSLFLFGGITLIIGAGLVMAGTGILEKTQLIPLSGFTCNSIYSAVSLVIPLGIVILICGALWSSLIMRQFTLYDKQGQKAVQVMQRGFGFLTESYLVFFVKSKEALLLERRRFSCLRHWKVLDKEHNVLAEIQETSLWRALLRKLTGHLWGMLRASYVVTGPMESTGTITNARAMFNRFTCQIDKPQAISSRDLLVATLVLNIRDRDKWYPWF